MTDQYDRFFINYGDVIERFKIVRVMCRRFKLPYSKKDFNEIVYEEEYEDDNETSPDTLSDGDDDPYLDIDINNIPDE